MRYTRTAHNSTTDWNDTGVVIAHQITTSQRTPSLTLFALLVKSSSSLLPPPPPPPLPPLLRLVGNKASLRSVWLWFPARRHGSSCCCWPLLFDVPHVRLLICFMFLYSRRVYLSILFCFLLFLLSSPFCSSSFSCSLLFDTEKNKKMDASQQRTSPTFQCSIMWSNHQIKNIPHLKNELVRMH